MKYKAIVFSYKIDQGTACVPLYIGSKKLINNNWHRNLHRFMKYKNFCRGGVEFRRKDKPRVKI